MAKIPPLLLILILLLVACGPRPSDKMSLNLDEIEIAKLQISDETMREIVRDIASPLEVTKLIHSLAIPFTSDYLPNPENLLSQNGALDMAFRLGMLYTDLGYIQMYGETDIAEGLLAGIDQLTSELNIGQFFDVTAIKRLATTSSGMDSLIFISINTFNQMGNYLRESNRGEESALMITGAWMEGLYMSTQSALQNNNEHLRSMIGDQKLILNDLLLVLNYFNEDSLVQNYINDLEKIMIIYEDVEIRHEMGDLETIEKDGMLEVFQPEFSQLIMSDEVLGELTRMTGQVRNAHLNIKTQAK